jgi:hypothetical protein
VPWIDEPVLQLDGRLYLGLPHGLSQTAREAAIRARRPTTSQNRLVFPDHRPGGDLADDKNSL